MPKIFVWIKDPGKKPRHVWITPSLENLQKLVDGYIEYVPLSTHFGVICNEEGRIRNLPYNCEISGTRFFGTIILAGVASEEFTDFPMKNATFKSIYFQLFEEG